MAERKGLNKIHFMQFLKVPLNTTQSPNIRGFIKLPITQSSIQLYQVILKMGSNRVAKNGTY
ncbi:MAG: hypothetical protein COA92_06740 [Sulfurovum sp.]|nr:MAG: hypothetical protein COA92_06740 [Sulfurovum sp.]